MSARGTRRKARSRAGYTLVEVMLALGVLAVGAAGIVGIQGLAIRGNQEASELATASRTVEFWLDRFRMDALAWRTGGSGTMPSGTMFANTELMRAMPATGSTGWFAPTAVRATSFPAAAQLAANGNPIVTSGAPTPVFCTQANLTWVYDGTAIRVDVRTAWRRRNGSATGALTCPASPDRVGYHIVSASTLIRWNPENPRRESAP